jgi:hypothetical protein
MQQLLKHKQNGIAPATLAAAQLPPGASLHLVRGAFSQEKSNLLVAAPQQVHDLRILETSSHTMLLTHKEFVSLSPNLNRFFAPSPTCRFSAANNLIVQRAAAAVVA